MGLYFGFIAEIKGGNLIRAKHENFVYLHKLCKYTKPINTGICIYGFYKSLDILYNYTFEQFFSFINKLLEV